MRNLTLGVAALSASLVLAACSNQRPMHIVRADGEAALKAGNFDKAKADLGTFVERKPDDMQTRYLYGRALIGAGEPRLAMEQLNVCLDVDPLNDKYLEAQAEAMYLANEREALAELLARACSERGRVTDYTLKGTYAQKVGNLDEAQQALLTAAKLDMGRTIAPQRALADFYGSVGDHAKQVRRLRMAYAIAPNNQELVDEIRKIGEIPGPSFAIAPE